MIDPRKVANQAAEIERARTIETLNKHRKMLMDLAKLASWVDDDDPVFYVNQAHVVQKCIELVKKQVN